MSAKLNRGQKVEVVFDIPHNKVPGGVEFNRPTLVPHGTLGEVVESNALETTVWFEHHHGLTCTVDTYALAPV